MKNREIIAVVAILIIAFLFLTKQGRQAVTRVFQQGAPVNIDFGSGVYEPGSYVLPDFQIPVVNGVSLPPPLSSLKDKNSSCCCSATPTRQQKPVIVPFVAPSVQPSYVAPPPMAVSVAPVSKAIEYKPPQEPDYAAYLRKYPDLMEFVQGPHLQQPHWTRGQGLREADFNRNGRVEPLEFAKWHWLNSGELEGRNMPMKDKY